MEYLQPNSHWRMSLERLGNDLGYTRENCVLVAAEFNTSDHSRNTATFKVHGTAQWSKEKVSSLAVARASNVDLIAIKKMIVDAQASVLQSRSPRIARMPNADGEWRCSRCGL